MCGRAHAMRRRRSDWRKRVGGNVADILVARQLNVGPAFVVNVVGDQRFAVKRLRIVAILRVRLAAQGSNLCDDAHDLAFDIARRFHGRADRPQRDRAAPASGACRILRCVRDPWSFQFASLRHDEVAKAFDVKRALDRPLNDDVAPVFVVAPAADDFELAHGVERAA